MIDLKIPIEQLRHEPYVLRLDATPADFELEDEEFSFETPIGGEVAFHIAGRDVLAHGALEARLVGRCVRCLQPAATMLRVPVDETWMHRAEHQRLREGSHIEEDALDYVHNGDFVEPAEVFRELIMAAIPERIYCQADCKGLCPVCGVNLNEASCQCDQATRDAHASERLPEWKRRLKGLHIES